jgi:hypothetical protein
MLVRFTPRVRPRAQWGSSSAAAHSVCRATQHDGCAQTSCRACDIGDVDADVMQFDGEANGFVAGHGVQRWPHARWRWADHSPTPTCCCHASMGRGYRCTNTRVSLRPNAPPPGSRRSRSARCGTATSHGCVRRASPPTWLPPGTAIPSAYPGRLWAGYRRPPDRSRGHLLLSGRTDLGHKASCGSIRLTRKTHSDAGQNGFSTWS